MLGLGRSRGMGWEQGLRLHAGGRGWCGMGWGCMASAEAGLQLGLGLRLRLGGRKSWG